MTPLQRAALGMVRRADLGEAYLTSAPSYTESGSRPDRPWTQAFIHWRTACALQRRGLVRIDGQGEDATIYLPTATSADRVAAEVTASAANGSTASRDDLQHRIDRTVAYMDALLQLPDLDQTTRIVCLATRASLLAAVAAGDFRTPGGAA